MTTEFSLYGNRNNNQIKSEFSSQIQLKSTEELFKPRRRWRKIVKWLVFVLIIVLAIAGGYALGYFVPRRVCQERSKEKTSTQEYIEKFKSMIDPKELENNLRRFTIRPHIATTQGGEILTDYILGTWKKYGFEVEVPEYDVLLSFPQEDKPNKVSVINNDTKDVEYNIIAQLNMTADPQGKTTYKYMPYLAYAPNGTVEGEIVYANRGWEDDFKVLDKRNISMKGKIVIMGTLFGSITIAQSKGAIGVILYPDPKFYAPEGHGFNDTYPNTPWLPPDGVQTVSLSPVFGDSLTPLLPSIQDMYSLKMNQTEKMPLIPAQTISYQDAQYILSRMKGEKVPKDWQGGFNFTYRFGPGFKSDSAGRTSIVRLEVNNEYVKKKIRNVIATIPGSEEPDRYVLIGNHKDAWTFGSSDPSSGTATLIEISRVLWKLLKDGWKPRRTIKLCSWGAEEFGLMGSFEWVEDNDALFGERAVAYLNTDVAVGGNFVFVTQSSPMLVDTIFKHLKQIQDPGNSTITIFDTMMERFQKSEQYPNEPHVLPFHFITDNIPFSLYTGLSTADFSYFYGYKNHYELYPLYHSQYDNFDWIKRFADPKFHYFKAMTQFLGSMLFELSDANILPFSIHRFANSVQKAYNSLNKSVTDRGYRLDQSQMLHLGKATEEFINMTKTFESAIKHLTSQQRSNPLILRMLNDQIAGLEKSFVSPYSKKTWPSYRKIVFRSKFLNINGALQLRVSQSEMDSLLKFEMSLIIRCMKVATKLLKPLQ